MLSLKAGSRYWHNHGNIENVKAANAVSLWEVRFVAFLLPDEEQDANEEKLSELERQHKEKSAAVTNAEQFAESLAQCAGMKKLTATVLNTLIEKIEGHDVGCAEELSCDSVHKNSEHRIVSATIPSFNIFLINNIKSHLKIKQLSCIIYLEVIGIESPIALSKNDYKK